MKKVLCGSVCSEWEVGSECVGGGSCAVRVYTGVVDCLYGWGRWEVSEWDHGLEDRNLSSLGLAGGGGARP